MQQLNELLNCFCCNNYRRDYTISVGDSPYEVAVAPDGNKVYVTNSGSNNISVIDAITNKVTAAVPVGNGPCDIGIFLIFSGSSPISK